jgi:hypothetical protein
MAHLIVTKTTVLKATPLPCRPAHSKKYVPPLQPSPGCPTRARPTDLPLRNRALYLSSRRRIPLPIYHVESELVLNHKPRVRLLPQKNDRAGSVTGSVKCIYRARVRRRDTTRQRWKATGVEHREALKSTGGLGGIINSPSQLDSCLRSSPDSCPAVGAGVPTCAPRRHRLSLHDDDDQQDRCYRNVELFSTW